MFQFRADTEADWCETVSVIFCMAAFISARWMSTVLLLQLLLPDRVLAAAVCSFPRKYKNIKPPTGEMEFLANEKLR